MKSPEIKIMAPLSTGITENLNAEPQDKVKVINNKQTKISKLMLPILHKSFKDGSDVMPIDSKLEPISCSTDSGGILSRRGSMMDRRRSLFSNRLKIANENGNTSIIPPASPSIMRLAAFSKLVNMNKGRNDNFGLSSSFGGRGLFAGKPRKIKRRQSENTDCDTDIRRKRTDMLARRVSLPPVIRRGSNHIVTDTEMTNARRDSQDASMTTVLGLAKWRMRMRNPTKKISPLQRFRRIARIVKGILGNFRDIHKKAAENEEQLLAVLQFSPDEIAESYLSSDHIMFDPSNYKVNKKDQLPQEARRILQMKTSERSEKEINYLLIVLRTNEAFAKYPMRMQRRLAQVAWYERYEARRAIVKQGHPPHNFYVILSGSLVVTVLDEEKKAAKPVAFLKRGMAFGELALITRSIRQGSVITRVPSELLVISVDDFEDIFMSGGIKNINDPDYNAFIRSISFLKNWPLHLLNADPKACMFNYFNRGQVLVRDSQYSDWIYIVKSGSISVMKKFRKTDPNLQQLALAYNNDKSLDTWRRKANRHHQISADVTQPLVFKNQIEMDTYLDRILPGYFDKSEKLGTVDYDKIIAANRRKLKHMKSVETFTLPKLTESTEKEINSEEMERSESPEYETENIKLPEIKKNTKGVYLSATKRIRDPKDHRKQKKTAKDVETPAAQTRPSSPETDMIKTLPETGIKTITDQMENKPRSRVIHLTEADLNPMFARVQILERGQYFGVRELIFDEQPSLSVISNGAECIMVSKKYFKDHASELVMQHLRKTEVPFPDNDELQRHLQDQINWEAHRANTYNQVVMDKQLFKSRRQQFSNHVPGQYNFRTGPV